MGQDAAETVCTPFCLTRPLCARSPRPTYVGAGPSLVRLARHIRAATGRMGGLPPIA